MTGSGAPATLYTLASTVSTVITRSPPTVTMLSTHGAGAATPLPGSDRWKALSEAEQKAIYAD